MNVFRKLHHLADAPPIRESLAILSQSEPQDICEDTDSLVLLSESDGLFIRPYYYSIGLPNAQPNVRVRKSIQLRLQAAARVLPDDISIIVLDGWRSAALQQEVLAHVRDKLSPSVDLGKYVFSSKNSQGYPTDAPPHRTGGAVDLILGDREAKPLAMGVKFDEMNSLAATQAFEEHDECSYSCDADLFQARRRSLFYAMTLAGFSNYPEEYWHYDYGNSFWRFYSHIHGSGSFGVIE